MQFGILTINWKDRTIEMAGISGDDPDDLVTADLITKALKNPPKSDRTLWGVVYHEDNGQLALHDRETWSMFLEEQTFQNFYKCPDCKVKWDSEWSSMCDEECPDCGTKNISPYKSGVL